jgi:hypothetical protein
MPDSKAVTVALRHIEAWSHRRWEETRQMLSPRVHAWVTNLQPGLARQAELTGAEDYMLRKEKAANLIEPGSVRVISTAGDERHALVLVSFLIGLGPEGAPVTMVRSCLYALDDDDRILEERDQFIVLPAGASD